LGDLSADCWRRGAATKEMGLGHRAHREPNRDHRAMHRPPRTLSELGVLCAEIC